MKLNKDKLEHWYHDNFEQSLKGLQIKFDDIEPLLKKMDSELKLSILGYSHLNKPIYKITIGTGKKKVMLWSQMHGNESTGTKAIFDLFNFFKNPGELAAFKEAILKNCTLEFIPILNPDGAEAYTRVNAQKIDLNRDAIDLKATESKLLLQELKVFNPKFCFNLHDQRTIFNVKGTKNPATISFLAPSVDVEKTITENRKETMSVILAMNSFLQNFIPNQIGRYTDEFYPTATGDNFQKAGHNTILIEAGHYPNDYEREITRKYNFYAILSGLLFISNNSIFKNYKPYFDIPNNDKCFFDIIYRNVIIDSDENSKITDIGLQYDYKIEKNLLNRFRKVKKIGNLEKYYAHKEFKMKNNVINIEKLLNS